MKMVKSEDLELKTGMKHHLSAASKAASVELYVVCHNGKTPTAAAHTHAQQTTMCLRH